MDVRLSRVILVLHVCWLEPSWSWCFSSGSALLSRHVAAFCLSALSQQSLGQLSDYICLQTALPESADGGLLPLCFCFSVMAESSWKVKGSSRTRSLCVPLTTPTRWPARGCLRWRKTVGAAPPSRLNPEPHIEVRTGSGLWEIMAKDQRQLKGRAQIYIWGLWLMIDTIIRRKT